MRKIATIRFNSRGMIRIRTPAISDMIGEMWAVVMTMKCLRIEACGKIESRPGFYPDARFHNSRRAPLRQVPAYEKCQKLQLSCGAVPGTMPRAMNWLGCVPAAKPARASSRRSFCMRNRIFAIAAIAGALGAPIAAQAQSEMTTGVVRGGPVIINEEVDGIAVDQRPAFREY